MSFTLRISRFDTQVSFQRLHLEHPRVTSLVVQHDFVHLEVQIQVAIAQGLDGFEFSEEW